VSTQQPSGWAVRVVTVAAVLLVAGVAAVVSYAHMEEVSRDAGEGWRALLLPLSVDGLVVAASMVLLTRRRAELPGGRLAWAALLGGVGASLAANMAAAEPTVTARLVAAWPALAFAVAFELLLQQRRVPAAPVPAGGDSPAAGPVDDEPDEVGEPVVDVPPTAAVDPVDPVDQQRTCDPDGAGHVGDQVDEVPSAPSAPCEPVDQAALSAVPPGAHPPDPVAELDDLTARVRALLAASNGRPPGRRALARELGVTEHRARTVLELVGATGPSNGADAPHGGDPR